MVCLVPPRLTLKQIDKPIYMSTYFSKDRNIFFKKGTIDKWINIYIYIYIYTGVKGKVNILCYEYSLKMIF